LIIAILTLRRFFFAIIATLLPPAITLTPLFHAIDYRHFAFATFSLFFIFDIDIDFTILISPPTAYFAMRRALRVFMPLPVVLLMICHYYAGCCQPPFSRFRYPPIRRRHFFATPPPRRFRHFRHADDYFIDCFRLLIFRRLHFRFAADY